MKSRTETKTARFAQNARLSRCDKAIARCIYSLPGRGNSPVTFKGFFHEILPGLGAFAIAPDESGTAHGMQALEEFLDEVLKHLANRTTAQERISYHVRKLSITGTSGRIWRGPLFRKKMFTPRDSAIPRRRRTWYSSRAVQTAAQRQLAESSEGFAYIRLGLKSRCFPRSSQISLGSATFAPHGGGTLRQVCSFCVNLVLA